MNKKDILNIIFEKKNSIINKNKGEAFANSNIALIKYWGKRNEELILPHASSLSYTLNNLGTRTSIKLSTKDKIIFNNIELNLNEDFSKRVFLFLDLFRNKNTFFEITTNNNIPTGAGIASSASGGAALILALNDLFNWNLSKEKLSILARLYSGSACRSVYNDTFVFWNKGKREDGMDSFAIPLKHEWPELSIKILTLYPQKKPINSRNAMKFAPTSPHFKQWVNNSDQNIENLLVAIKNKDFETFGQIIEENCLFMHKIMQTSNPSINYFLENTFSVIEKIYELRKNTIQLYFTIDAGPNIKLFYLKKDEKLIDQYFK